MLRAVRAFSNRALDSTRAAVQPEALCKYRIFRPVSHKLSDPVYWDTSTRSMTIGVSAGLLWAFWLPVGQILAACFLALWLRGNLPAAAAATFVSNPFTIGPLSYLAHHIGTLIMGPQAVSAIAATAHAELSSLDTVHAVQVHLSNLGLPWLVGMAALGVICAAAGLMLTPLLMHLLRRR